MWTDIPDENCTCRWVNRSDDSGWYRTKRNPDCPIHKGA